MLEKNLNIQGVHIGDASANKLPRYNCASLTNVFFPPFPAVFTHFLSSKDPLLICSRGDSTCTCEFRCDCFARQVKTEPSDGDISAAQWRISCGSDSAA